MKKTLVILATVVSVVLLGNVLIASAQGGGPGAPRNADMADMHEAVWTAVAKELGMTYEQLVAATQSGKTIWQLAAEKGVSIERLRQVMLDARKAALADLVKQGVITQEQADWMLNHSQGMMGGGFGSCGGNPGSMMGGRGMMSGQGMSGGRGMRGGFGQMHPWGKPPAVPNTSG